MFNGHGSYITVKQPRGFSSHDSRAAKKFCTKIIRDAENTWREEQGIPLFGEGWVSESLHNYQVKSAFPHLDVEHHARPVWLSPQHLDIFIPALSVAIEFQGFSTTNPSPSLADWPPLNKGALAMRASSIYAHATACVSSMCAKTMSCLRYCRRSRTE